MTLIHALLLALSVYSAGPDLEIHHPEGRADWAKAVAALVREAMGDLEARLGFGLTLRRGEKVRVYIATTDADYEALGRRIAGEKPRAWSLATAYPHHKLILVRAGSLEVLGNFSSRVTLRHEVVHLFVDEIERRGGQSVPVWFNEGVAEWCSDRRLTPEERNRLERERKGGTLPDLAVFAVEMPPHHDDVELAYLQALGYMEFLAREAGPESIGAICGWLARGDSLHNAFRNVCGSSPEELEARWHEDLHSGYSLVSDLFLTLDAFVICALLALVAGVMVLRRNKRRKEAMPD